MLTPPQIQAILDRHEQKRPLSCFQSAVEMVLKLNGVLAEGEYPEQAVAANDRCGYEPFAGQTKQYGPTRVEFTEIKFEPIDAAAYEKGRELLRQGIYPIYSFQWPTGGFHGFVGFLNEQGEMEFITKDQVGHCAAKRYTLAQMASAQRKTEILVAKILPVQRAAAPPPCP